MTKVSFQADFPRKILIPIKTPQLITLGREAAI